MAENNEVCIPKVTPPVEEKPPCPTCVPNRNYIAPTWHQTDEPYLNQKTCEYMVSVTINDFGDTYTTSTVKNWKEPNNNTMNPNLPGKFDDLLRSYVRSGLRLLLRHFGKLESDKVVCATYSEDPKAEYGFGNVALDRKCRGIYDVDLDEFVSYKTRFASLEGTDSYKVYNIDEKISERFPRITNINALEIYARAIDYHFTGFNESVMKVLVAIPAFIFDQVPDAPPVPTVDTSVETLIISPRKLRKELAELREALNVFQQYQAFFYKYQNGDLINPETGEKFYLKFYIKRIDLFESALEKLLNKNGLSYATFLSLNTPSLPFKIKFVFDKSDEKNPFKIKRVGAKIEGCKFEKLTVGLSSFNKKPFIQDQTLMGYIANINNMADDLNARETVGWLDFVLKYTYPPLVVNYGSKEKYKEKTAVNCLGDKLQMDGGLDDFVHEAVGQFSDLFSYAINKNACKALRGQDVDNDKTFQDAINEQGNLYDDYYKQKEKNKKLKVGRPSVLEQMLKDIKDNYDAINGSENKLRAVLSELNPCNMMGLATDAIKCLLAGMTLSDGYSILIKKALGSMAGPALEKVIESLPYDKQEKIRELVTSQFKDMPAPWEVGYEPGNWDFLDRQALKNIEENIARTKGAVDSLLSNQEKIKSATKIKDGLKSCIDNPNPCTEAGGPAPLPPPPYQQLDFTKELKQGDKGKEVEALQTALKTLAKISGYRGKVDGDFGPGTKKYVKKFQRAKRKAPEKLKRTGVVDANTRNSINAELIKNAGGPVESPPGLYSRIFKEEMQRIKEEQSESGLGLQAAEAGLEIWEDKLKKEEEAIKELFDQIEDTINDIRAAEEKVQKYKQEQAAKPTETNDLWLLIYRTNNDILELEGELEALERQHEYRLNVRTNIFQRIKQSKKNVLLAKAKKKETDSVGISYIDKVEKRVDKRIEALKKQWRFDVEMINEQIRKLQKEVDIARFAEGKLPDETDMLAKYPDWNDKVIKKGKSVDKYSKKQKEEMLAEEQQRWAMSVADFGLNHAALANWDNLTEEEQAEMIAEEADKAAAMGVTLSPDDQITQGTYGTALGNLQQAVASAYIDAILEVAEINELIKVIDKLPGAKLIGSLVATMDCPVNHFIYPPISSFLKTLTFDPCGPGKTRLKLPELLDIPNFNGWNLIKYLASTFMRALWDVTVQMIFAIIYKLASIVFEQTCAMLGQAARGATKFITGDLGWRNAVDDIFCGDQLPEDERGDHAVAVINAAAPQIKNASQADTAGLRPEDVPSPKALVETLSVIGTKDEFKRAITSTPDEQDMDFMKNLSTLVAARHPEYAPYLGTSDKMVQFFSQVGNLLTSDQIAAISDSLESEDGPLPLDNSICLTNEELENWKTARQNALENAGLDGEIARDFVERQEQRRKSDLSDLADIIINGPENMVGDAIQEALNGVGGANEADPDCSISKAAVKAESIPAVQDAVSKAQDGMFKRLESAFLDDVILWRWPTDPRGWNDPPGILSTILGDKANYTLNFHYIARSNIFYKIMKFTTFGAWPKHEDFPETVGITYRDALIDTEFKVEQDKIKFPIKYSITDDAEWKSRVVITDSWKEIVEGAGGGAAGRYERNIDKFVYKFKQRSPANYLGNFKVRKPMTSEMSQWASENNLMPKNRELVNNTLKDLVLRNYLNMVWKDFQTVSVSISQAKKINIGLKKIINNKFMNSLVSVETDQVSPGFQHGSKNMEILAEHLEYVGPDGEDYDYDEVESVFGKAKSANDRVKFLNPEEYGGSYTQPNIYISPPKDEGLMAISQVFIPDIRTGCNPKISTTHFMFFDELKERINNARSKIPTHKNLKFSPDCVNEIPFDKVASPATLASLEGIVIATIKVYLADLFTKTMPIWSNISLRASMDGQGLANYDELLVTYVAKLMERGLQNEKSIFARSTYEGYPYWLMFLEQAAQVVQRKVKNGDIEKNDEIKRAFKVINDLQKQHVVPDRHALIALGMEYTGDVNIGSDYYDDYLAESVISGGALLGGKYEKGIPKNEPSKASSVLWGLFGLNEAKFSAKIWTLHKGRHAAKTLLKYLIQEEIKFYSVKIAEKLDQLNIRPYHYDIVKTFIGKRGVAIGQSVESGLEEVEREDRPPEIARPYGDVNNVSFIPMEKHPLSGTKISKGDFDFLQRHGGFYLEKYLRIHDRDETLPSDSEVVIPEFIKNRPIGLRGVVSVEEFKRFISVSSKSIEGVKEGSIGPDIMISDYFSEKTPIGMEKRSSTNPMANVGAAAGFGEVETEYETNVGIKYGVRLCYIPSSGFNPFPANRPSAEDIERAKLEKSFICAPAVFEVSSRVVENPFTQTDAENIAAEVLTSGGTATDIYVAVQQADKEQKTNIYTEVSSVSLEGSRYSFPLISFEQSLRDGPLADLGEMDDNLNQDLKCYIDRLVESNEFELIMDKILDIKRVPSVLMAMTYDNWVPSIGARGSDERNEPEVPEAYEDVEGEPPQYTDAESVTHFNDSRAECRKLFISNYKRDDFDPPDEEEDYDFVKDTTSRIMSDTFSAVLYGDDVPFWMKWRVLKENPDDEDGNPCGNSFSKLFKEKDEEST